MYQASVSAKDLFELVWMQVEKHFFSSPVATIRVEAIATTALKYHQRELFAQGPHEDLRRLARLINRLTGRLGRSAVLGVRLVADAQPELAYRNCPLVDQRRDRRKRAGMMPVERASRPLLLLARPIPLRLISCGAGGNPLRFQERGRSHRAAAVWGPERIETGWWRGRSIGRDYYRVETSQGHRLWLFRRLDDGRWFLHGRFQ